MIEKTHDPELVEAELEIPILDISHLITEDDTPVDNIYSEKQQRLLTEPLHTSWEGPPGEDRDFVALANVGVFDNIARQAIVPDAMVSLHVHLPEELWEKNHRSYFIWEYGKPPDVVIEIVSNRKGEELGQKQRRYARMAVTYYVVHDPQQLLSNQTLHIFERQRSAYVPLDEAWFPEIGLGLTLWRGEYENLPGVWLRWCDEQGRVIPTGAELAEEERQKAEQERQRAEREKQRAERLVAQLRALGVDPEA